MRKFIVIFYFLVIYTNSSFSKEESVDLRFRKITVEQGLPHNYVHSITQDKKGFIWVGTNYGLARFDGYNFKTFRPDPQKPFSISHKPISNVFADSRGNIWLYINLGVVNRMDLNTERFKVFYNDSSGKYLLGKDFAYFHEDSDTNLWIITQSGIFTYDRKTDALVYTFQKKTNNVSNTQITSFADDQEGNIWYTEGGHIGVLDKHNYKIKSIGEYFNNRFLDTINYQRVYSNLKGTIWFATRSNGLIRYKSNDNKFDYFLKNVFNLIYVFIDRLGNLYVISDVPTYGLHVCRKENLDKKLFESFKPLGNLSMNFWLKMVDDRFGNIYITCNNGFARFNILTGLKVFQSNEFDPNAPSEVSIESVLVDASDNLWICPYRKGLNKADLRQKPFKFYNLEINKLEDLKLDKNVSSVFIDKRENIWMGNSKGGVNIRNKKDGKIYTYKVQNATDPITSIIEDKYGDFWLGTFGTNLLKINSKNYPSLNNNSTSFLNSESFPIVGVRRIIEDSLKNLWFASSDGIVNYDQKSKRFTNYSTSYDSQQSISWFHRVIYIDKKGLVWTGTNGGGLVQFNPKDHSFKHYLNNPDDKKTLSNNIVYAIYEDSLGSFWLGTGQGLEKFNPNKGEFEHMGNKDLRMMSIFSIIPDKLGNLWMSADVGIGKYNIASGSSVFFSEADGLHNNEYATTASFISKSGELFYGGTKGLVSFYPSQIKSNPNLPVPVITNFLVHNKVISPGDSFNNRVLITKQLWDTKEIELNYYETDFTIEFSSLHYSAPEKAQFFYKMEGFNDVWINTKANRRYASYTGLPPGEYTFVLKASNNDGLMSNDADEVRLKIIINPPFWQTVWFKILSVLMLIAAVLLFISYRVRTLRHKNLVLDQKVKERTKDLEKANTILEERQEEINLQKEEIQAQYETLESANHILQEQQKKIVEQNTELDHHRNKLEFLVIERTKELEKALLKAEESDKLKTSFLTNMSHEIRTPMNAIIGFSSLLRDEELADKRDEFINIIETNGRSLLTLINDILELSSLQSQQVSLSPKNNNLSSILKKIYETFKIETDKQQLKLELKTSLIGDSYFLAFDEIRLQQTLSNLLANAIKFTEKGGIEFGIHEITDKICFYVKDTGIGIPKEVGNTIFERFYKVERNTNQLFRGTGLGLAICKSIVELWKGEIWYTSEPGVGTTFYFTYPVSGKSITIEKKPVEQTSLDLDLSDKCILIAEDEYSNYKLLENFLKKTKVRILWAHDGFEALQFIDGQSIDLVLMDIKMPKMNGIEAALLIREKFPKLPIIAQTAFAFKNEVDEILSSGINSYLTKPINKNDLLELIKKHLLL